LKRLGLMRCVDMWLMGKSYWLVDEMLEKTAENAVLRLWKSTLPPIELGLLPVKALAPVTISSLPAIDFDLLPGNKG